ncbi:hypothetical protein VSU16_14720 (plasmid) [Cetobacterium somerae]|uniref:hypothetical protein n=1 Tax=Cetobacterium somerae TaxID=188913 RepID=UPI002E7C2DC0|nr:hypothetical protein [Cetobacterium somerae]WVJ03173.1 hypothetical protein VSU16_14720 [Cetobacterium somerae]
MFNYINIDTQNLMSYRDDYYKDSYTTRLVGKKEIKSISKNVIGTDYRTSKLSPINPLLPKEIFGDNDDISYMRFGNKDGVGIAFVGKFREGSDNPDEISVYLGRETGIGDDKGFTLFKKLKDTPGFQDFYKYGNSYYTSKSRMVYGGIDNRDGVTVMKNSGYELVQMARMFFKKAEIEESKEWKLMESIRKLDFGAIDDKPYYPKSDSWSIKTDKLTSGSLETAVFDMSQITDASILKPKASIGEQYNVKSFFNNQIFDKVKSTIKRESSSNRINFSKFLNNMEDKPITAIEFKEALLKHESEQLELAFSPFNEVMRNTVFSEKERKIKGIDLLSSFKNSNDFINKKELMKEEMKKLISSKMGVDTNSANEKLSTFIFSNKEIASISSKVDTYYKDVENIYKNKLKDVIKSKINESIDDGKYNLLLSSTSKENFKPTVNLLNSESVMKFYDKYNLKLDMLDIINERRSKTNFSDNEIDALKVKITRDDNGKILDIKDVINPYNKKGNVVYSKQDAEDAWAYIRAKSKPYKIPFKEMDIETKLKHMEEYKKNNNSIFETHKEKTLLGKYDSVDSFNKAFEKMSLDMKRESNSGTSIARTYDKITGNIDYETNNLVVNAKTIERFGKNKMWINFNIKIDDGFDRSDYIKYIQQDKQAVMKEMSLDDQKYISKITAMYRENNRLQKSIGNLIAGIERNKKDNYIETKDELMGFKSILKGHNIGKKRYMKILEDGNLKSEERYKIKEGKYSYSDLYKSIINILDKKYNHTFYSDFNKDSSVNSETILLQKIMKIGKESNNTVFNMILNNDDIINTTGAAKQTGVIGGDTYMGHLGSVLPGVAWNKVTQRTFQAQDLLGERTLNIKNSNGEYIIKTRSAINAELLSKTRLTGVGSRKAFYKTEELVKDTIEHIRKENKLKDMPYRRGETYKTFAIGDVRAILPEEGNINAFTASFQEGMTATRALQSTTNAIRNKSVKINLDELNYEALGISKLEAHNLLKTETGMNQILSKILSKDLFGTIEGRKKLENFYEDLNNSRVINTMDGSIGSLQTAYSFINNELGGKGKIIGDILNDEASKMKLTKGIMDLLDSADGKFRSVAYAKGKNGKVNITNDEFTTKHLSLKPEVGFSIGSANYNAQENAIELMLENIGSVDQGSKQQTTGAKYTISEVYDFIKVKSKDKELYVDAIFNNKAEKRMQTGMMIHGALQTMVTNVYEDLGAEGIKTFNKEMKELLGDLGVEIKLSKEFGVLIDETYLTKDMKGNSLTAEKFLELSKEPIENQNKIFTEKGKEILENVEKKYGASFYSPDGELKKGQVAQYGILAKMQQSYSAVYNSFDRKETAFMIGDATLEGFTEGKSSGFGNGPVLLLKLASERVNSNANKKKDSGLKVGKGINEMIRINGYDQLSDYIDSKNQDRVNDYLGTVYNNLTNSEVLNKIYDYKQDINMEELTESVAKSTSNGIVFDLNSVSKDDYILNKTDAFLSHDKLMKESVLGKKMVENSLDSVSNGKLEKNVTVVINDKNINEFAGSIKNKLDITMEYFRNSDNKFSKKILNSLEGISNLNTLTDTEIEEVSSYVRNVNSEIYKEINKLSGYAGKELEIDALASTSELLNIFSNNSKNKYSLNQLQTIFKTGNVLTSMELSYDVSESDGTIVSSEVFSRLRNIADKSKEYESGRRISYDFMLKALNKEEGITEKTFKEYIDYFDKNSESFEDISTFNRLINKTKFDSDKVKSVVSDIKTNLDKKKLHSISVINANKFIQEKMNTIDKNNADFDGIVREIDNRLSAEMNDILESNKKIAEILTDKEVSNEIVSKLNGAIFNGRELSEGVKFSDVFRDEVSNQTSKGFDLLKEYIKIPDEAKGLHKNKGKLSSSQKFKIKSSFIANPLEGSNLLNKFENIMFEDVSNVDDIKQNLKEFGDFMGFKLVNEKLFVEDGVDYLENLSGGDGSFKNGIEKAKQVFGKNLANISEVTITSKEYLKSFRDKKYKYEDVYTGKNIKEKGFVRDFSFFARHPQQTINHMGGVQSIILDIDNENLKNRFSRSALTFLSKEKNQAGVITVGKKTMLFRRGDQWSPYREICRKKYCERLTIGVLAA